MNAEYIRHVAVRLAESTRDPFEAAGDCGAKVSYKDIGSLKGAYFGALTPPAIVINSGLCENMQRTVCAHELGHHLLHRGMTQSCSSISFGSEGSILERDANIFAAFFLIDDKRALELLRQGYAVEGAAAILETDVNLLLFLLSVLRLSDTPDSKFLNHTPQNL